MRKTGLSFLVMSSYSTSSAFKSPFSYAIAAYGLPIYVNQSILCALSYELTLFDQYYVFEVYPSGYTRDKMFICYTL